MPSSSSIRPSNLPPPVYPWVNRIVRSRITKKAERRIIWNEYLSKHVLLPISYNVVHETRNRSIRTSPNPNANVVLEHNYVPGTTSTYEQRSSAYDIHINPCAVLFFVPTPSVYVGTASCRGCQHSSTPIWFAFRIGHSCCRDMRVRACALYEVVDWRHCGPALWRIAAFAAFVSFVFFLSKEGQKQTHYSYCCLFLIETKRGRYIHTYAEKQHANQGRRSREKQNVNRYRLLQMFSLEKVGGYY